MPALKDRLKYLRNYNGKNPNKEGVQDRGNKPTTAIKHHPKIPSIPLHSVEDQAAVTRHLKFLQAEEKKLHPNKQVN